MTIRHPIITTWSATAPTGSQPDLRLTINRTQQYKTFYLAVIVWAIIVGAIVHQLVGTVGIVIIAAVMLVPGRVGAYFLRDLFLSRRFVVSKQYEKAITSSQRYLRSLERQPWRQHFIYCFFAIYTWKTGAMAFNNLGAAEMERGRLEDAEKHFARALSIDQEYPIPYYNLAILAAAQEDYERSENMANKARLLGYTSNAFDQAVERVGSAYARLC